MRSTKKLILVAACTIAVLALMAGPALAVAAQSSAGDSSNAAASDGATAAIVMLTGVPILAYVILTRNIRRRLVDTP